MLDYLTSVSTLFPDDPTEQDYKMAIKELHKSVVESTINAYPNNKVLDDIPFCFGTNPLLHSIRWY